MGILARGLVAAACATLLAGAAQGQAFFSNLVVNTCTTLNCATPIQGESRIWSVNEFYGAVLGNVDIAQRPFTMIVNTGGDEECMRIDIRFQSTNLSATLISQEGRKVWYSNDRSPTDQRPLIIAALPAGHYELQINQEREPYKNAYFKLFQARYHVGNDPNCRLADLTNPVDLAAVR